MPPLRGFTTPPKKTTKTVAPKVTLPKPVAAKPVAPAPVKTTKPKTTSKTTAKPKVLPPTPTFPPVEQPPVLDQLRNLLPVSTRRDVPVSGIQAQVQKYGKGGTTAPYSGPLVRLTGDTQSAAAQAVIGRSAEGYGSDPFGVLGGGYVSATPGALEAQKQERERQTRVARSIGGHYTAQQVRYANLWNDPNLLPTVMSPQMANDLGIPLETYVKWYDEEGRRRQITEPGTGGLPTYGDAGTGGKAASGQRVGTGTSGADLRGWRYGVIQWRF